MQPPTPDNPDLSQAPDRRPVGLPRQYGIRTMMMITAVYAVLFGCLASAQAPPGVYVVVGVFIGGVGLAQMFLFRGTRPREASILAGSALLFLGAAILVVAAHIARQRGDGVFLWTVVFMPAIGALLGYLVGTAIASPFLIADRLKHRRAASQQAVECQQPAGTDEAESSQC
jgi:MFS family permease